MVSLLNGILSTECNLNVNVSDVQTTKLFFSYESVLKLAIHFIYLFIFKWNAFL